MLDINLVLFGHLWLSRDGPIKAKVAVWPRGLRQDEIASTYAEATIYHSLAYSGIPEEALCCMHVHHAQVPRDSPDRL
jgi:hypothetical protein